MDQIDRGKKVLSYAFGYLTSAIRGEIPPVLSRKRVKEWLSERGEYGRIVDEVYESLERLAT